MFDCDVIIVGGGPAGLTAGIYLSRAKYRVLIIEKEAFGGQLKNIELIENYPGFADGISGAKLATEMIQQTVKSGAQLETGEVTGIESFSSTRLVGCADGKGYTCSAVVIAGGARPKRLGVPGEELFLGKGLIHCALCDGGQFTDRVVAVCGGGDAGVSEALYLSKFVSKIILIEALPDLTATPVLKERVTQDPKIEVHCGTRVVRIVGTDKIEAVETVHTDNDMNSIPVDGVLVHTGILPNSDYLDGTISLGDNGQILVNSNLETDISSIVAAGDIRNGSPQQVAAAVGDGTIAAISVQKFLQTAAQ